MTSAADQLLSRVAVTPYTLLFVGGIVITGIVWYRLTRNPAQRDARLAAIYFCGLWGALVGAKLAFLLAEGWQYRDDWLALLSGKSITGGLLGGYAAVELAKKYLGYQRVTGDLFAITVPIGIAMGRIGCLMQGCCAGMKCDSHWWTTVDADGVHRWPAQLVELAFNICFAAWVALAARRGWMQLNRFHVYLIAYGAFRFCHEFLRDERRMAGDFTGYHLLALAMVVTGSVRLVQRLRTHPPAARSI